MNTKYVKLPSSYGGNITDNSLLDFDIPSYGTYDLSKSYITVMADATTDELDPTIVGIHSATTDNAQNFPLRNNCLICDYSFSSNTVGSIDNLMSSNVLNCNLDVFSRDFEQMYSDNYKQFCKFRDPSYKFPTIEMWSMFR